MKIAKRFRAVALIAAAATALSLAGCSSDTPGGGDGDGSNETTTIRVATSVSNSFPFVVVQAAERLGTFEGTGLDVQVVEGTTPTIGQIMAGNQADIALAGAGSEAASIQSGVPLTIVASDLSYWDQRIIARPGIESVEDLKGRNFGISGAGSPGEYSVVKMAESLGWSDDDYTVTSLGNLQSITAALAAGSIDAFAWSSDAAFRMEKDGSGQILAPAADYVGTNVLQAFAVNNDFAAKNPKAVQTFFRAYFDTVKKIQADPQLFIDVLVEDWGVDADVAQRLADESLPRLSADGKISEQEMDGVIESAAFTLDIPVDEMGDIPFVYWEDLK